MKKTLVSALTTALVVGAASTTFAAANPFADVPADHWAYDAVAQLVQDGIVNGYAVDGTFKGDQNMSRYEMAQIVAKAMAKTEAADNNNKALIEKLAAEFSDELANLGVRVADLEAKTDNVKWNGLLRYDWNVRNFEGDGAHRSPQDNTLKLRFEPSMTINENWTGHARIDYDIDKDNTSAGDSVEVAKIYAEGVHGKLDTKIGRFGSFSDASHGLVFDTETTGIEFEYAPTSEWKVKATAGRYTPNYNLAVGTDFKINKDQDGFDGDDSATYWAVEANYRNGKWDAGVGYHNILDTTTNQYGVYNKKDGDVPAYINGGRDGSFHVIDLGLGYAFDKNVKLIADYAFGPSLDGYYNKAPKDAYSVELDYKGADAAQKGSWGAYLAYRQYSPFASFEPTQDIKKGQLGLMSLKGWEIGADYTWAKNIVSTVKYFNGKDTLAVGDDKATGMWTRVDFMF